MSISSFVNKGLHFGKLGERKAEHFGTIELYDIGELKTIGAFYVDDHSRQAQPVGWHGDEFADRLAKLRKKNGIQRTEQPLEWKQQLRKDEGEGKGKKELSLAEELRRLMHRDDPVMPPKKSKIAEPSKAQAEARKEFGKRARQRAAEREPEAVEIPTGALEKLKQWKEDVGNCRAIHALVASYPAMNRSSVVAAAEKCGIKPTTAKNEYSIQKKANRSLETILAHKKVKAKAPKPKLSKVKKAEQKPSKVKVYKGKAAQKVVAPKPKSKPKSKSNRR